MCTVHCLGSVYIQPGWLLLGISELAMGAHPLPGLKLLTSHNSSGHKLEQGFYFPGYQEKPQCGCLYDAPGLFSHFGSSFFWLLASHQIFCSDRLFLHLRYSSIPAPAAVSMLFSFVKLITLYTQGPASVFKWRGGSSLFPHWASTSAVWALLVLAAPHESKSAREDVIHPLPQEALQDVFVLNAWWFFTCLVNLPQLGCLFRGDRRGKMP